jgi:hypothetical protein
MVIVTGLEGTYLYDVSDPLHPRLVCRILNTSVHILSGTSFEYLMPQPNATTRVVLHTLGTNNESVVATFPADLTGANLASPFPSVSWPAVPSIIGYATQGGLDSQGATNIDVWAVTPTHSVKLLTYPVPGVDGFGRPGPPPPVLAISPDGAYAVAGWVLTQPSLHVFRLSDNVDVSPALPSGVRIAFWSRAGHTLYIVGGSGVEMWTPESGSAPLPATPPWTLEPNSSPDDSQVAFTALPSNAVRVYVYDLKAKSSRLLIDQPRSAAMFVKSGWVWYLEETACVESSDQACFDPTVPDGNVLAMNLATGQETPVTFAAGEAPVRPNLTYMVSGDVWPHG